MNSRKSKMYALILTLLSLMIVTGCGELFRPKINKRPDDDISKAIYEAVGRKKVYYRGNKIYNLGKDSDNPVEVVGYEYLVRDYEDENVLVDMAEAANVIIKENEVTEKIRLDIMGELAGGIEGLVTLCNYYKDEDQYQQYETLQCLYIIGSKHRERSPYNKVSIYINLPDIKSLVVSKKIAQAAEDEGIDWYEIWPDLEHYRVFEW